MKRRTFVQTTLALPVLSALPAIAAEESDLIYLSPVKSDGTLSRCQAEVWYAGDGGNFYVVTAADAWRAKAVGLGLTDTKVWIGDVGQWQRSRGKYLELPSVQARASLVTDAVEHARLLGIFGNKYTAEWGSWGPRFKKGLADGSRVMLRYTPAV